MSLQRLKYLMTMIFLWDLTVVPVAQRNFPTNERERMLIPAYTVGQAACDMSTFPEDFDKSLERVLCIIISVVVVFFILVVSFGDRIINKTLEIFQ